MTHKGDNDSFAEQAFFKLTPQDIGEPQEQDLQPKKAAKAPPREKKHYEGHRERLRQRFLATDGLGLADYEFLELLLFRSIPRADTKPLAKALLAHFGTLADVLGADIRLLKEIPGCGAAVATDLKIIGATVGRANKSTLKKRDVFSSWDKIIAYCKAVMAHESREQFRILFLDKKNGLIADEIHQTGTVDHTPVYPREVVKRALELAASSIILVHNHPSGNPEPSHQDVAMTMKLMEVARSLNITILDHLIIGRNGHASLKSLNLM